VLFLSLIFCKQEEKLCSSGAFQVEPASYYCRLESLEKLRKFEDIKLKYFTSLYWSESSSRHFLRFLSNIFKKQSRNLCFTSLLFCMNHNDLPTKWIFIKKSTRWSGIHYYDVAFFNRKWQQQKQFSPTFRNIVFCEAKTSKGKKNDILEN
jgi:hypothetical protein